MLFAGLNLHPNIASKLNLFIGFGPVFSVEYIENTFLRFLAEYNIDELLKWLGFEEFLPPFQSGLGKIIAEYFCYFGNL